MDLTIVSYEITKYALLYNFFLFACWLVLVKREGGHVSGVYLIVMILFAFRLYGVFLGIEARELRCSGGDMKLYYDFMSGFWWESRLVPEAVVFIILAAVLTKRFVLSYIYRDPQYRTKNGRRKADSE